MAIDKRHLRGQVLYLQAVSLPLVSDIAFAMSRLQECTPPSLQAILNHKDRSVTAIYDQYPLGPEKQEALVRWGRRLEQVAGGEPGGQVVEFRTRSAV